MSPNAFLSYCHSSAAFKQVVSGECTFLNTIKHCYRCGAHRAVNKEKCSSTYIENIKTQHYWWKYIRTIKTLHTKKNKKQNKN